MHVPRPVSFWAITECDLLLLCRTRPLPLESLMVSSSGQLWAGASSGAVGMAEPGGVRGPQMIWVSRQETALRLTKAVVTTQRGCVLWSAPAAVTPPTGAQACHLVCAQILGSGSSGSVCWAVLTWGISCGCSQAADFRGPAWGWTSSFFPRGSLPRGSLLGASVPLQGSSSRGCRRSSGALVTAGDRGNPEQGKLK